MREAFRYPTTGQHQVSCLVSCLKISYSSEHEFVGRKPTHQQLLEESKKMRSENEQLKERVSINFESVFT